MNTIVAFDFDGTLTKIDSFHKFILFSKGKRRFYFGLLYIGLVSFFLNIKILKRHDAKQAVFSFFF